MVSFILLIREVESRKLKAGSQMASRIIEVVYKQQTLSVRTIQTYLDSLLAIHRYDEYVESICQLREASRDKCFTCSLLTNTYFITVIPSLGFRQSPDEPIPNQCSSCHEAIL
jgi:hypothetical protein